MPEIQKADPRARRNALWLFAVTVVAGSALLAWIELSPVGLGPERFAQSPGAVVLMLAILLALAAWAAVYAWRTGRRVVSAERFPPPGMLVVRDTPVHTGRRARLTGYVMMGLAVLILLSAAGAAAIIYLLLQLLGDG